MPKWPLTLAIVVLPLAAAAAESTHDVNATFVSADAKSHIFTIKLEDGTSSTGKAKGDAKKKLGDFKYGDRIVVTCEDNDKGEHVAATDIKAAK